MFPFNYVNIILVISLLALQPCHKLVHIIKCLMSSKYQTTYHVPTRLNNETPLKPASSTESIGHAINGRLIRLVCLLMEGPWRFESSSNNTNCNSDCRHTLMLFPSPCNVLIIIRDVITVLFCRGKRKFIESHVCTCNYYLDLFLSLF